MSKWNTTKLIAISGLVAIWIALSLVGASIQAATGIVGAAGITAMFLSPIIFVLCPLLVRKFGAATIMATIYGILALPLPVMGTPGFIPKIIIAISAGIVIDILYSFLKQRKKLFAVINGAATQLVIGYELAYFMILFKIPGTEIMTKVLLYPFAFLIPICGGAIGGYLGYLIYNKLKNTAIVKRIQA